MDPDVMILLSMLVLQSIGSAMMSVLHPDILYETIGRMLQVLDGQSWRSTSICTEHKVYYCKRHRIDRT
ncbi:hypothetical protein CsSME_00019717 [Camellia sinensis var. sinensis]